MIKFVGHSECGVWSVGYSELKWKEIIKNKKLEWSYTSN